MVKTVKGWMQNQVNALVSRKPAIQNFQSKWRGGNLLFWVQHLFFFLVGTRMIECTNVNLKGTVQCMLGSNWCCWFCCRKDELVGGGQGARNRQSNHKPDVACCYKKEDYDTERTWSSALEVVLLLCLAPGRPRLKYQTSFGDPCFRKRIGHLEEAQKILVSMAGGLEAIPIKI